MSRSKRRAVIVEVSPPKLRNRDVIVARERAHAVFDMLWVCGWLSKNAAYDWLRKEFHRPGVEAHIGRMSIEECRRIEQRVAVEIGRKGFVAAGLGGDIGVERAKWQSEATKLKAENEKLRARLGIVDKEQTA